ncbi:hypothetical protein [Natrinema sp. DC36]|uniref:hypothetical protein n=1 Tax=Natrinema sp. DC36 TaxID=2878680 RepID=UPI001CF03225|nr:hypothetical protein [Natrinema sp. DC36]
MSQGSGSVWESIRTGAQSHRFTQIPTTPESAEVSALVVLALSLFTVMALGNLVGLW